MAKYEYDHQPRENAVIVDITEEFNGMVYAGGLETVPELLFRAKETLSFLDSAWIKDPVLYGGALRDAYIYSWYSRDKRCEFSKKWADGDAPINSITMMGDRVFAD